MARRRRRRTAAAATRALTRDRENQGETHGDGLSDQYPRRWSMRLSRSSSPATNRLKFSQKVSSQRTNGNGDTPAM